MVKFIKKLLFIFLFSSVSLLSYAQIGNFEDGKYNTTNEDISAIWLSGVHPLKTLDLTITENGTTKRLQYHIPKNSDHSAVLDENYQIGKGYNNELERMLFLQNENKIIRYKIKEGEGSFDKRITIIGIIGKNRKSIKKETNPDDYLKIAIDFENKYYYERLEEKYKKLIVKGDENIRKYKSVRWGETDHSYYYRDALGSYTSASKIKPNETYPKEQLVKLKEMKANKQGDWEKLADKNISEHELPKKATVVYTKLETQVLSSMRKNYTTVRDFYKYYPSQQKGQVNATFTKVLFYSKEWGTERNQLTGIITGKSISFVVIGKTEKGDCFYLLGYSAYRAYNGSSYGNLIVKRSGTPYYIECDKIK